MIDSHFIAGTAAQLAAEYGVDLNGAAWGVVEFQGDLMDDGVGFESKEAILAEFKHDADALSFL